MLNYRFVYNNSDKNVQLLFDNEFDFIKDKNFINEEALATDDFNDIEISKYVLTSNISINFNFFNGSNYSTDFTSAGFTTDEINVSNKKYRYSYFLIQIYDTFDSKNQRLLHTGYIPIYLFPDRTKSIFLIDVNTKYYEFNNIYLSNDFQLSDNNILYLKFSFFNAKVGRLFPFYNHQILTNTDEKLYYKITANNINKSYSFNNSTITPYQFLNEEFINRVNERNKKENKSPIFTQGDLFNINGDYV